MWGSLLGSTNGIHIPPRSQTTRGTALGSSMWRGILSRHPQQAAILLTRGFAHNHPYLGHSLSSTARPHLRLHATPWQSSSTSSTSSTAGSRRLICHATAEAQTQDVPEPEVRKRPRCSPLHFNVEEFAIAVVPTEDERKVKHLVIDIVRGCVKKAFLSSSRRVEVEAFGSFVNNLSTWNSDVDLVVTGVMEPDRYTGGFGRVERRVVAGHLERIAAQLRRHKKLDLAKLHIIKSAKIPIIKLRTKQHVTVDISLGDDSGPRAANYIVQQQRLFPPLRPLVVVLKCYLRSCGLNEVATGGLSSYSLTNMVIAHLQEELKVGRDIYDLGECLYSFLLRYGDEFVYWEDAVSVASGGIVPKSALGYANENSRNSYMGSFLEGEVPLTERLCVDDPLTGRDVAVGSYRIDLVKSALQKAARRLEALAKGRKLTDTTINYLSALFDVQKVIKRQYHHDDDEYYVVGRAPRRGNRYSDIEEDEYGDDEQDSTAEEAYGDDEMQDVPTSQRSSRGRR